MKFVSNAEFNEPIEKGNVFRAQAGSLEIVVHKLIHCEGWYVSCPEMGMHNKPLKSIGLLAALKEAEIKVKTRVEKVHADITKAAAENIEVSRY